MVVQGIKIIVTNRKAGHEYELGAKYEAGIVLKGTEVKSIRAGRINIADGWVEVDHKGEAILHEVQISHYSHGNVMNHEEKQPRKLLLSRVEINKIAHQTETKGLTVVPTKVYLKNGFVKIEIAMAKGKKAHDKRQSDKAKDANREMARALRPSRT
jgi:SsrA-binding protein